MAEYEYSALLYLVSHSDADPDADPDAATPAAPLSPSTEGRVGAFSGGRLVFHDADADRVVLPLGGMLVAFTSGAPNLHAVERVVSGSRFALTMWFTTKPATAAAAAAADPSHVALQQWAVAEADAAAAAATAPPPPPPLPPRAATLASREDRIASAALCSLPANDALCQALLLSMARSGGGQLAESLGLGIGLPPEQAHAAPHHASFAGVEGMWEGAAAAHPLLRARGRSLEALLNTLRRARGQLAEMRAPSGKRHLAASEPPQKQSDPNENPFSVFEGDAPTPATDDPFSVFD